MTNPNVIGENNSAPESENPWGKAYQESIPPFKGEEQDKFKDEYYFDEHGVERRDLRKIDISTEEGKYDYLTSLVEERQIGLEEKLADAKEDGDENQIKSIEDELSRIQKQRKIVQGIDLTTGRSVMELLEERRQKEYDLWVNTPGASDEAKNLAEEYTFEAGDLVDWLSQEMADRDPAYFGINNMTKTINNNLREATKKAEATMIDKEIDEHGHVHYLPEKKPSSMTSDAEIELKEAKAEAEVYQELIDDYQKEHDYHAPNLMSKAEFRSRIEREITTLTGEINRAKKALGVAREEGNQNHSGYQPLTETRDNFVRKRKALKRLLEKYF